MSPEGWIALAAVVVAGVSTYLTYQTGKEAREDAHRLASEARDAAAVEARASRLFDRRKDVYEEIVEYVFLIEEVAELEATSVESGNYPPPPPTWPSDEAVRRQGAQASIWASPELLQQLYELRTVSRGLRDAVSAVEEQRVLGEVTPIAMLAVKQKRHAIGEIVHSIASVASQDLRG